MVTDREYIALVVFSVTLTGVLVAAALLLPTFAAIAVVVAITAGIFAGMWLLATGRWPR